MYDKDEKPDDEAKSEALERVEAAFSSPKWWYNIRGTGILTFAYHDTVWSQVRFFEKNIRSPHLEVPVGTGTLFGLVLRYRKWKTGERPVATAIDISKQMVSLTQRAFRKAPNVTVERGDVTRLSYEDNHFRSVNIGNGFHCFPEPEASLREIFRVLAPGGTLAANVLLYPLGSGIQRKIAEGVISWGKGKGMLQTPYTETEVEQLLRGAGFEEWSLTRKGNSVYVVAKKPQPSPAERAGPDARLDSLGIGTNAGYRDAAFNRCLGIYDKADLLRLSSIRVAVPGLGGVGGVHLALLARCGIGAFTLADLDTFDLSNINRQYGAKSSHIGLPKLDCMADEVLDINPHLDIRRFPEGVHPEQIDDFLDGVDIVVDGLDLFEIELRRKLFRRAREKGIYVVSGSPIGTGSCVLVFSPYEGMTFDEYFDFRDGEPLRDVVESFLLAFPPRIDYFRYIKPGGLQFEKRIAPSLAIGCQMSSVLVATEVLRIALRRGRIPSVPAYNYFDPLLRRQRRGRLLFGNRHPWQRTKRYIAKNFLRKS